MEKEFSWQGSNIQTSLEVFKMTEHKATEHFRFALANLQGSLATRITVKIYDILDLRLFEKYGQKKYVDKQSPKFYQLLKEYLKAEHPRWSPNNQKLAILPWNNHHKMYALCKQTT